MKILFFPSDCQPIYRRILEEKPLGGTETGVIRLANALADLGHDVIIISETTDTSANPKFLRTDDPSLLLGVDLFIAVRNWRPAFFFRIKRKRTFFWTGDDANTLHNFGIGDLRVHSELDALLCVSHWQASILSRLSLFPPNKIWLLRNGVYLPNFEGSEIRNNKRLIFTSHPLRGLRFLPPIFNALKIKHPDLELHVFGGSSTHGKEENTEMQLLLDELSKTKGCFVHGPVRQQELSRELMRSRIWIYPTDFSETSCISAMEAQAAGCAIVSSHLAALPETVGQAGILLHESPDSQAYLDNFINTVDKLLTDNNLCNSLSLKGLEQAKSYDWKQRALSFLDYVKSTHKLE